MDVDDDSDQISHGRQSPISKKRRHTDVNPFLLPTYGSFNENEEGREIKPEKVPVKKRPHLNFKRFARAITQQRKLNSLLQVRRIHL